MARTAVVLLSSLSQISFAQGEVEVHTTSQLARHNRLSYDAKNLTDRDAHTAWCARVRESPKAGIAIVINSQTPINGVGLVNGYTKTDRLYKANNRVREIKLLAKSGQLGVKEIEDSSAPQWIGFPASTQGEIRLLIEDYYKGSSYDDVCVTELIVDKTTSDALATLLSLVQSSPDRARSAGDALSLSKDFVENYYLSGKRNKAFWDSLRFVSSRADTKSLRLILDLNYYAHKANRTTDAELSEGLRDQIVQIIERNPEAVIEVLSDREQLMRERIVNAYAMYIDPFGDKAFKEMMVRSPALAKLNQVIHEYSKELTE